MRRTTSLAIQIAGGALGIGILLAGLLGFSAGLAGQTSGNDLASQGPTQQEASSFLSAAFAAEAWMRNHELRTESGLAWPVAPEVSDDSSTGLYHGSCGGILFLLALHHATADDAAEFHYMRDARLAADELIRQLPAGSDQQPECGLYTGLAGIGFTLQQVADATDEDKYMAAARDCLEIIKRSAQVIEQPGRTGDRPGAVRWNDSTDIISGTAGIGLYLLNAAQQSGDPEALRLAVAAGEGLLQQAEQTPAGLSWKMSPGYVRDMPNFSHGTAGVAYFLCQLSQHSGDKRFLDAAIAGAEHLQSIANHEHDGLCIYHHSPDGENLYYLGWCHGPPGTARLFYTLGKATGDQRWHDHVHAAARSVMKSGIPAQRTAGFWNNSGMCCGDAGVAEFFLELSLVYDRPEYRAFALQLAEHVLLQAIRSDGQAATDDEQLRWRHAENRTQPDKLSAQTGYMQGSAGIGIMLLRMHAAQNGAGQPVRLPDAPYASD